MKERIQYIDAIRGFAIFLVVIAHAIAWNYPDWHKVCLFNQAQSANVMAGGVVWQVIYSFHMALFFMVSGYLSGNSTINKENFFSKLKSKFIRLLVPYLTTGFLIYFVRGNWGYWFLLSLFEMAVLWLLMSSLLTKVNPQKKFWIDLILMATVYILLRGFTLIIPMCIGDINFGIFIKYFVPFCFGCLMKRHRMIETSVRKEWCFTCCLIVFAVLFLTRYITDYPILYKIVEKADYFFSILALLACAIAFHIFMNGIENRKERYFAYLGKISMPIYILHNLFVLQIPAIGIFMLQQNAVTSITLQIVSSVALSAVSIILSIWLYNFISRSSILKLLLFGEKD